MFLHVTRGMCFACPSGLRKAERVSWGCQVCASKCMIKGRLGELQERALEISSIFNTADASLHLIWGANPTQRVSTAHAALRDPGAGASKSW